MIDVLWLADLPGFEIPPPALAAFTFGRAHSNGRICFELGSFESLGAYLLAFPALTELDLWDLRASRPRQPDSSSFPLDGTFPSTLHNLRVHNNYTYLNPDTSTCLLHTLQHQHLPLLRNLSIFLTCGSYFPLDSWRLLVLGAVEPFGSRLASLEILSDSTEGPESSVLKRISVLCPNLVKIRFNLRSLSGLIKDLPLLTLPLVTTVVLEWQLWRPWLSTPPELLLCVNALSAARNRGGLPSLGAVLLVGCGFLQNEDPSPKHTAQMDAIVRAFLQAGLAVEDNDGMTWTAGTSAYDSTRFRC